MKRPFSAILTADLHGSVEDLDLFLQELADCATLALERGMGYAVIAGDFFDHRFRFPIELLLATYDALERWQRRGITFIIIRGNHDVRDNTAPEESVLKLFSKVAIVVNTPMLVEEEDCVLLLMPWYPPTQFRPLLQHFASFAIGYVKPRILISHVSLQEGLVSPSNTRVSTPIRVKDLLPDVWTKVYLGDYHRSQDVTDKVKYLGRPRPGTHGDSGCLGVWEVNAHGARVIPLPSRYPEYNTYRVDSLEDLPIQGYDAFNRNRCYCPDKLQTYLHAEYPDMKLLPTETVPVLADGRLQVVDVEDKLAVALKWAELRKLGPEFKSEIRRVLQ